MASATSSLTRERTASEHPRPDRVPWGAFHTEVRGPSSHPERGTLARSPVLDEPETAFV